jgi:ABC-type multidrug transport system fused ATPase/permease subunit
VAADRILVLDQGRVAEDGTHRDLLDRNGLYTRLYRLQAGREARRAGA